MRSNQAYELFNTSLREDGLAINAPKTICDVSQAEIPLYVELLGGRAVVKVPYSNAGQVSFSPKGSHDECVCLLGTIS